MTPALAALPLLTLVSGTVAAVPGDADPAPVRLAVIRGALLTGAVGAVGTEALSAVHLLSSGTVVLLWALAVVAAAALAVRRRPGIRLPRLDVPAWVLVAGVAALAVAELVVAVVAVPDNADSLSYHLPRVEHWAQDGSVAFYPTAIHRQAGTSPGAEYLLLQLRLLAGPDEFDNLVQWLAALGCAVVASRIAAQLGAGRIGQLLTAVTVASAPMVALESTSTQTDLVVAFWVACGASLALDRGGTGWLGLAAGLTTLTKVNGLAVLAPFLVLWLVRRAPRGWRVSARDAALVALLAALVAGPFLVRSQQEWGNPLGDPDMRSIALGRHDPAAITINGVRVAATVLATTSGTVNAHVVGAVDGLAHWLHIRDADPRMTFGGMPFGPVALPYPDEDHAAYPIQALAVLVALGLGLVRRRPYAVAVAASLLVTAALIAWQPWINRLILPTFVAGTPLVGWAADRLLARWRRAGPVLVAVVVLVAGVRAGYTVWAGQPRPLGTANSVLTIARQHGRYVRARDLEGPYRQAAQRIAASGATRVGLLQTNVGLEYPWWIELRRAGAAPTIVSLTSVLPRHPAPRMDTVDAVVCTLPADVCTQWTLPGWAAVAYPGVTVLLREKR